MNTNYLITKHLAADLALICGKMEKIGTNTMPQVRPITISKIPQDSNLCIGITTKRKTP